MLDDSRLNTPETTLPSTPTNSRRDYCMHGREKVMSQLFQTLGFQASVLGHLITSAEPAIVV
jgi:hypothetical protein